MGDYRSPNTGTMAVKGNNPILKNHFRKDWQRRVRVHFDQPGKKASRRNTRKEKAARVAPKPVDKLRPIVRCPTVKYNRPRRRPRQVLQLRPPHQQQGCHPGGEAFREPLHRERLPHSPRRPLGGPPYRQAREACQGQGRGGGEQEEIDVERVHLLQRKWVILARPAFDGWVDSVLVMGKAPPKSCQSTNTQTLHSIRHGLEKSKIILHAQK